MNRDVLKWLTARSDPSLRLRVFTELLDRPENDPQVVRARREIGKRGWAASILDRQLPDGQWTIPFREVNDLYWPLHTASIWQLIVLADLGMTRRDPRIERAAGLFLDRFEGALGGSGRRRNQGPSGKLCVTGNVVRMMYRFGFGDDPRVQRSTSWLVRSQLDDGGWNCDASQTTGNLDDWEALGAFAAIPKPARTPAIERAIERGAEFFLQRKLMEPGPRYEPWFRLHYPVHFYYDLLVGLDILTSLGHTDDARLAPALDWLEARRRPNGRWPVDLPHPDLDSSVPGEDLSDEGSSGTFFSLGLELPGHSSRWITTTALTVLRRVGRI